MDMELATIDLAQPRAQVARQVDACCRATGFMHVTGHGVPAEVIGRALAAADEFFALPLREKLQAEVPAPDVNRGYSAPGSESLSYTLDREAPPDLFESFTIGDPEPRAVPTGAFANLYAPNVWPAGPAPLRPALESYHRALRGLAERVSAIAAVALGVSADFFVSRSRQSADVLRVIHYPASPEPPPQRSSRLGAHTDYGLLTLLYADAVPGLELLGGDDRWTPVMPRPGGFIVNIGDLLAQWTNDRWTSTVHRVRPLPQGPTPRRRSIAYFHNVDPETMVDALPTCTAGPPRYRSVRAGDHYLAKLVAPRTMRPAGAVSTIGGRSLDALAPVQGGER